MQQSYRIKRGNAPTTNESLKLGIKGIIRQIFLNSLYIPPVATGYTSETTNPALFLKPQELTNTVVEMKFNSTTIIDDYCGSTKDNLNIIEENIQVDNETKVIVNLRPIEETPDGTHSFNPDLLITIVYDQDDNNNNFRTPKK